ncbi:MAG: hypothetical protein LBP28_04195 [Coriobacteriales bacterium]|nr:hypothetical protein [Coriobacteriales bacterium]
MSKLNKISSKVLQSNASVKLRVLVDASASPTVLRHAYEQLFPLGDDVSCEVVGFNDERPHLDAKAELNLLIAGSNSANASLIVQAAELDIALVTIATDFPTLVTQLDAACEPDDGRESNDTINFISNIIVAPTPGWLNNVAEQLGATTTIPAAEQRGTAAADGNRATAAAAAGQLSDEQLSALFAELGRWVARNLPGLRQSFGQAYPFMRRPIALEIIRSAAFVNAIIAAAFFIPGADMPVLTANQARMLFQIAALYGLEPGTARIKEIAVLVAGAFCSRALARQLVARLTPLAWAIRATFGYSTTLAVGHAALTYYEKTTAQGGGDR